MKHSLIGQAHQWQREWWGGGVADVRHAVRGLLQTPGVTGAIVVMLALGIGANAAIYGILEKLFLRPPSHVSDPEGVVRLYRTGWDSTGSASASFSHDQYTALSEGAPSLSEVAGAVLRHYYVGHGQRAEPTAVSLVTGGFFRLLGAQPFLGRFLSPEDDREAASAAAVISHAYWRRRYGGRESALGGSVTLSDVTYTIVGVAPPGFSGPDLDATDIWIPIHIAAPVENGSSWRGVWWLRLFGRLSPGVTAALAREQATSILRAQSAGEAPRERVTVGPINEALGPGTAPRGLRLPVVVGGVSAILLLVSSSNATVLLLLRAARRRRELAVRSVLGADSWRITRLLVIESLVLAVGAGLAAAASASLTSGTLRLSLLPNSSWVTPAFDLHVLAFSGALALAIGLVTGLLPAALSNRRVGLEELKAGTRVSDRGQAPIRSALLVMQAALALVLLLGAAVFYRSLDAARSEEVGFDVEHLLVVQLYRLQERRAVGVPDDVVSAMTDRVSRLPNVAGIAQSTVSAAWWSSVLTQRIAPQQLLASQSESPSVAGVTPNFFAMNGLSIERGRGFSDADDAAAPKVAVVSRSLARTLWPAVEPIDQCLSAGPVDPTQCVRVVGLVEDVGARVSGPDQFPRAYVPLLQSARNSGPRSLVIRTLDDPGRVIAPVLGIMAQLLPDLPRERVQALPDLLASRLRPWKVGGGLFMAAGGLALLVAAIGLYATTAFGVRLREHEFGIRRAVGATPRHLLLLAMRQTVAYAAGGIALGTVLGQWGARFVDPLLFRGVSARDPTVYLLAAIVLLATCLTATTFPARAAARVDPRLSLQAE